jgi:hypothetical protein
MINEGKHAYVNHNICIIRLVLYICNGFLIGLMILLKLNVWEVRAAQVDFDGKSIPYKIPPPRRQLNKQKSLKKP